MEKQMEKIEKREVDIKAEVKTEPKQEVEVIPAQEPTQIKRKYGRKQPYQKSVRINVMEDKLCYNKKYLSPEEIDYRLKNGYHESVQYNIYGTKHTYLLKPRSNESDEHLFLIYQIKNFLEKLTKKVWTFQANNPDIVFETFDGVKMAVEVETGQVLKHSPKQLENKVRLLKDRFGDNWFFVMTNRNYASKYQKYGETIDKRSLVNKLQSYFPDVEPSKPVTKSVISQNADISPETPEIEALSS